MTEPKASLFARYAGVARHLPYLVLAILFVAMDQWTKRAIETYFMDPHAPTSDIPILGGLLHLTYTRNTGGAFGVLGGESVSATLLIVSVLALGFIAWYYWTYRSSAWMRVALTFIGAGAVGNLTDRLRLDYVIDFIDLDIGSYQWPYFNIADSLICTGAAMLIINLAKDRYARPQPEGVDDGVS